MMQIMSRVFGFTKGVRLDASTFSLVTLGAKPNCTRCSGFRIMTIQVAR